MFAELPSNASFWNLTLPSAHLYSTPLSSPQIWESLNAETGKKSREKRWRRLWSGTNQEWPAWRTCRFSRMARRPEDSLRSDTLAGSLTQDPVPWPCSWPFSAPSLGACTRLDRATRFAGKTFNPTLLPQLISISISFAEFRVFWSMNFHSG